LKRKVLIVVPVLLLASGLVWKLAIAKPPPAHKPKIDGVVYVLPKGFLVNLAGGRYAKLDVGLVLAHDMHVGGEGEESAKPPEGSEPW
jgi:hypothetical protein